MTCPKCRASNSLRVNDDGPYCRMCGWAPTVEACHVCKCPGACQGHLFGRSESKNREMRPCAACAPVAEGATR